MAQELLPGNIRSLTGLRDYFLKLLREGAGVTLNGHHTERLPNTLNVSFWGINGVELLASVPEIAASTGAACHSGAQTTSPVLAAMGLEPERSHGAVRLSLGRWTTKEEVERATQLLIRQATNLRKNNMNCS